MSQVKTPPARKTAAAAPVPAPVAPQAIVESQPVSDFSDMAGLGLENADIDSFAIPFLSVLQKGSPQVDEATGKAIEGAKAGMFYMNVGDKLYPGNPGVTIIQCHYRSLFVRWKQRGEGGGAGFRGELTRDAVARMLDEGTAKDIGGKLFAANDDGKIDPEKSDKLVDTRNHYVLVVNEDTGEWQSALMSLTSTQIKKSRNLSTLLRGIRLRNAAGIPYMPPTFASIVRARTAGEANDKGTWFGVNFSIERQLVRGEPEDDELLTAAREFYQAIEAGNVQAKYEEPEGGRGEDDGKF